MKVSECCLLNFIKADKDSGTVPVCTDSVKCSCVSVGFDLLLFCLDGAADGIDLRATRAAADSRFYNE